MRPLSGRSLIFELLAFEHVPALVTSPDFASAVPARESTRVVPSARVVRIFFMCLLLREVGLVHAASAGPGAGVDCTLVVRPRAGRPIGPSVRPGPTSGARRASGGSSGAGTVVDPC